MGTDDTMRTALAPQIAEAEVVIEAAIPADMGEVITMVRCGDVEGARVAADAFGRCLGSRVRAALGLSGNADG